MPGLTSARVNHDIHFPLLANFHSKFRRYSGRTLAYHHVLATRGVRAKLPGSCAASHRFDSPPDALFPKLPKQLHSRARTVVSSRINN